MTRVWNGTVEISIVNGEFAVVETAPLARGFYTHGYFRRYDDAVALAQALRAS